MEMLFENLSPVFFVDAMLGNIAKKLRIMGFDCMYDANIDDNELIKQAKKDNRIIISKDFELVKKSSNFGVRSIFLEKGNEFEQLYEIILKLNLKKIEIDGDNARCPKCNSKTEFIKKDLVSNKLPTGVLDHNEKFWICKNCDKVFWEGSHMISLKKFAKRLNERL